jgi:hypothetical protein
LLLTAEIRQAAALHRSDAEAATVILTILWFGGHNAFGVAVTSPIVGGVVSTIFTRTESSDACPKVSTTFKK